MVMKMCKKCGKLLPLENFYDSNVSKDGKSCYCKECSRLYVKEYGKRLMIARTLHKIGFNAEEIEKMTGWSNKEIFKELKYKECKKCKRYLPIKDFNRDSTKLDGYHSYCKSCKSQNPSEPKEETGKGIILKSCDKCKRLLPITSFSKNKSKKDGLQCHCKECAVEYELTRRKKSRAICGDVKLLDGLHGISKSEVNENINEKYNSNMKDVTQEPKTNESLKLHKVYAHAELAKFTPRQLMEELKARGFKWDYIIEPLRKIGFDQI